ncbi:MAG: hypothetical protein ABJB12_18445 [Pseudomonadota bacterium]
METLKASMTQDLKLAGFSVSTQSIYLRAMLEFAHFLARSPAEIGQPEVRTWVDHLTARGLSAQRRAATFRGVEVPVRTYAWASRSNSIPFLAKRRAKTTNRARQG